MSMRHLMLVCVMMLCLCTISLPVNAEGPLDWLFSLFVEPNQNQEVVGMTHAETVAAFRGLGIDVPDETVLDVEQSLADMNSQMAQYGFTRDEQPWDFPLMLLGRLGSGDYNYDTGIWTATSSDVYAFDAEVFDISHMYALFLQGVSSIVPGFECTDVTEVIDEWSEAEIAAKGLLAGGAEGITTVRFTLNAHIYERQLAFYGDWFDTAAIDWINEVLTAEGYDGQLCAFSDGGQGLILFYGDEARIEQLHKVIVQPPWGF